MKKIKRCQKASIIRC